MIARVGLDRGPLDARSWRLDYLASVFSLQENFIWLLAQNRKRVLRERGHALHEGAVGNEKRNGDAEMRSGNTGNGEARERESSSGIRDAGLGFTGSPEPHRALRKFTNAGTAQSVWW